MVGVLAIGIAEQEAVLGLASEAQRFLARYVETGDLQVLDMAKLGFTADSHVDRMIDVGSYGFIVLGGFGIANEGKDDTKGQVLWLKPDGSLRLFDGASFGSPESRVEQMQFTKDGRLWLRYQATFDGRALGYIDLKTGEFHQLTDDQQSIESFVATVSGDVFLSGQVRATSAKFIRKVKTDSSGFEVLSNMPEFAFGDSVFAPSNWEGIGGSRGTTEVIEVAGGKMRFSYLPSILNWPRRAGQDRAIELPLVGDTWLVTQSASASGSLVALDIGAKKMPGPLLGADAVLIDEAQGLVFDGANVLQIILDGAKLKIVTHRRLISDKANGYRVLRLFGPKQGYTTKWRAVIQRSGAFSGYWFADVDPETGLIDVDHRTKLVSGNGELFGRFPELVRKVGSRSFLVYYGEIYQFSEPAANDPEVTLTEATGMQTHSLRIHHGLLRNGVMYLPEGDSINAYDTASGTVTNVDRFDQAPNCYRIMRLFEVGGATKKPAALAKRWSGECGNTADKLYVLEFGDWSGGLTTTNLVAAHELGETPRYTDYAIFADKNGARFLAPSDASPLLLLTPDSFSVSGQIVSSQGIASDETVYFAKQFPYSDIEMVAAWGNDRVLTAGLIDNEYRVQRTSLVQRTSEFLADLDGVQVYFAKTIGSRVFVNGHRVATNERVTRTYDLAGTLLSEQTASAFKILSLNPVMSQKAE